MSLGAIKERGDAMAGPTQTPSPEHTLFDRLCERVEDFDYLTVDFAPPVDPDPEDEPEEEALDDLILAGLVTPV